MARRHEFHLDVLTHIPTYNRMRTMTLREMMRMRKVVQTALYDSFKAMGIQSTVDHRQRGRKTQFTYRLPEGCLFETHVVCEAHVYRRKGEDRCDPHNFVTPVDKLLIDMLQVPMGNRWRGFGLITDDGPEYFKLAPIVLHQASPSAHVRLVFKAGILPTTLREMEEEPEHPYRSKRHAEAAKKRAEKRRASDVDNGKANGES